MPIAPGDEDPDDLHYSDGRQKIRKIVIRCTSEAVFEALRTRLRGARGEANGGNSGEGP
jgi:hypothetical protein